MEGFYYAPGAGPKRNGRRNRKPALYPSRHGCATTEETLETVWTVCLWGRAHFLADHGTAYEHVRLISVLDALKNEVIELRNEVGRPVKTDEILVPLEVAQMEMFPNV